MHNKIKKGTIPMIAGFTLVIMSLLLTSYNIWSEYRAGRYAEDILSNMNIEAPELMEGEIPNYILNPDMDMPEMEIDGRNYIGTLYISGLDLTLPVMSELTYPNLRVAPCRYKGSAYKNNLIIAAHNYKTHFGNIKNLPLGSSVTFTDSDGNRFDYAIEDIQTINGTNIEEMEEGSWDLSLFTCNYRGNARITLRCNLVE